jgi:hypothetical protein
MLVYQRVTIILVFMGEMGGFRPPCVFPPPGCQEQKNVTGVLIVVGRGDLLRCYRVTGTTQNQSPKKHKQFTDLRCLWCLIIPLLRSLSVQTKSKVEGWCLQSSPESQFLEKHKGSGGTYDHLDIFAKLRTQGNTCILLPELPPPSHVHVKRLQNGLALNLPIFFR